MSLPSPTSCTLPTFIMDCQKYSCMHLRRRRLTMLNPRLQPGDRHTPKDGAPWGHYLMPDQYMHCVKSLFLSQDFTHCPKNGPVWSTSPNASLASHPYKSYARGRCNISAMITARRSPERPPTRTGIGAARPPGRNVCTCCVVSGKAVARFWPSNSAGVKDAGIEAAATGGEALSPVSST